MIDGLPAGPVCGPAPLVLTIDGLSVPVYPDANNVSLRASGQAASYYLAVPRAALAARRDGSGPDFTMRAMAEQPSPDQAYIGGSCTLSTDLSVPASLVAQVTAALTGTSLARPADRVAVLFQHAADDPAPVIQPVPVSSSTIRVALSGVLTAQPERTGPVSGLARTTILVSTDPVATAAVVGNLRGGRAPFELRTILTENFDTGAAAYDVLARVDPCRLYAAYRAALPAPGPLVITGDVPDAAHDAGLDSGAIRIEIRGVDKTAPLDWISRSDPVKAAVAGVVKDILFDSVTSAAGGPGGASVSGGTGGVARPVVRDWWDQALSGAAATLRAQAPAPGTTVTAQITLSGPVTAGRAVPTGFDDLIAATAAHLDAYLLVVYVGGFNP